MKKTLLLCLSAVMVSPLAVLLGASNAWSDAGDDSLMAFVSQSYPHALQSAQVGAQAGNLLALFTLGRIYEEGDGVEQNKTEANKWFRQALSKAKPAAQKGDARAEYVLGKMYKEGWVLPKDANLAAGWYRKAADQGYAVAQVNLGLMYYIGEGVPWDLKQYVAWRRKAAEQGDAYGQSSLGDALRDSDPKESLSWYRKAAEQGFASAQVNVAQAYANGGILTPDHEEAIAWARKAAEQGNSAGQYLLGTLYEGSQDYKEALSWYLKAEKKQPYAQFRIGVMYSLGQGVTQDHKEAAAWYRKAAKHGTPEAQVLLGMTYQQGDGVPRDYKEAIAWYRRAADGIFKDPGAQAQLGQMYFYGEGVAQDDKEAFSWWRKAAEQGFAVAQISVGAMYENGRGVPQDYKEATAWYLKAAEQGEPTAQFNLGNMYYKGQGVPQNYEEAAAWWRKAAEQGNASAQLYIGLLYHDGQGVGQNYVEAYKWLILAAAQADPNAPKEMEKLSQLMTRDQIAEAQKLASEFKVVGTQEKMKTAAKESALIFAKEFPPQKRHASDIDAPSFTLPPNPNNFALVIGIEKYQKLPAAQFAEHDAETMRKYLLRLGYPERNIIYLAGENATRSSLTSYLDEWLPKNVNAGSTVFVYFSGHGAPAEETKQAYLVPWDADIKFVQSSAYPLKSLYAALNRLKAKRKIVVLDACFSGAGGRSVLAEGTRPLITKVSAGADLRGVVLFAAASADETTGTLNEEGHGIFTYYFLKGLAGKAQGPSGAVTADGLYRYLKPLVQDAAHRQNREQTPMMAGSTSGEIILRK